MNEYKEIGFQSGDANLYAYVDGSPLSYSDPTGNCPLCAAGVVVGVGAFVGGLSNFTGTLIAGGSFPQAVSSAGVGALAGAVPTFAGVALGVGIDLGIQFAYAPSSLPDGTSITDVHKGLDAIINGPSCPNK